MNSENDQQPGSVPLVSPSNAETFIFNRVFAFTHTSGLIHSKERFPRMGEIKDWNNTDPKYILEEDRKLKLQWPSDMIDPDQVDHSGTAVSNVDHWSNSSDSDEETRYANGLQLVSLESIPKNDDDVQEQYFGYSKSNRKNKHSEGESFFAAHSNALFRRIFRTFWPITHELTAISKVLSQMPIELQLKVEKALCVADVQEILDEHLNRPQLILNGIRAIVLEQGLDVRLRFLEILENSYDVVSLLRGNASLEWKMEKNDQDELVSPDESFMMDDACLKLYQLSENLDKYSGAGLLGTSYTNNCGTGHRGYMFCEKGCMAFMDDGLISNDSDGNLETESVSDKETCPICNAALERGAYASPRMALVDQMSNRAVRVSMRRRCLESLRYGVMDFFTSSRYEELRQTPVTNAGYESTEKKYFETDYEFPIMLYFYYKKSSGTCTVVAINLALPTHDKMAEGNRMVLMVFPMTDDGTVPGDINSFLRPLVDDFKEMSSRGFLANIEQQEPIRVYAHLVGVGGSVKAASRVFGMMEEKETELACLRCFTPKSNKYGFKFHKNTDYGVRDDEFFVKLKSKYDERIQHIHLNGTQKMGHVEWMEAKEETFKEHGMKEYSILFEMGSMGSTKKAYVPDLLEIGYKTVVRIIYMEVIHGRKKSPLRLDEDARKVFFSLTELQSLVQEQLGLAGFNVASMKKDPETKIKSEALITIIDLLAIAIDLSKMEMKNKVVLLEMLMLVKALTTPVTTKRRVSHIHESCRRVVVMFARMMRRNKIYGSLNVHMMLHLTESISQVGLPVYYWTQPMEHAFGYVAKVATVRPVGYAVAKMARDAQLVARVAGLRRAWTVGAVIPCRNEIVDEYMAEEVLPPVVSAENHDNGSANSGDELQEGEDNFRLRIAEERNMERSALLTYFGTSDAYNLPVNRYRTHRGLAFVGSGSGGVGKGSFVRVRNEWLFYLRPGDEDDVSTVGKSYFYARFIKAVTYQTAQEVPPGTPMPPISPLQMHARHFAIVQRVRENVLRERAFVPEQLSLGYGKRRKRRGRADPKRGKADKFVYGHYMEGNVFLEPRYEVVPLDYIGGPAYIFPIRPGGDRTQFCVVDPGLVGYGLSGEADYGAVLSRGDEKVYGNKFGMLVWSERDRNYARFGNSVPPAMEVIGVDTAIARENAEDGNVSEYDDLSECSTQED